MSMMRSIARYLLTVLGSSILLAACMPPPPPVYVLQAPPGEVQVPSAPPEPREEVAPPQPDPSAVWQDGYWNWTGSEYAWVPGDWAEPPQPDYVFVGPAYGYFGGSWSYRPGFWAHRDHAPRYRARGGVAHGGGSRSVVPGRQPGPTNPPEAVRVQAPDVITPTKVRAVAPESDRTPPAPGTVAPQAHHQPSDSRSDEARRERQMQGRTVVLREEDEARGHGTRVERVTADTSVDRHQATDLRRNPSFRGVRGGRAVFGDDPTSVQPRAYPTDHTGAIVLHGGEGGGRRSVHLDRAAPGERMIDRPRAYHSPDVLPPRTYTPTMQPRTYTPTMQPRTYTPTMQPRTYTPTMQPRTYTPTYHAPAPSYRPTPPSYQAPRHAPSGGGHFSGGHSGGGGGRRR
jgi:hypothetical protein